MLHAVGSVALDVRKLAALDMAAHGKRFIVSEFGLGVVGPALFGVLSVWGGLRSGAAWETALGIWLLFIGLNYVPLLIHAVDLARLGASVTVDASARRYGVLQLWILVPLAVVIMNVTQRAGSRA